MMNEKEIQEAAKSVIDKLVDEIGVPNQLEHLLKDYPEDSREQIEDAVYEWLAEEYPL